MSLLASLYKVQITNYQYSCTATDDLIALLWLSSTEKEHNLDQCSALLCTSLAAIPG